MAAAPTIQVQPVASTSSITPKAMQQLAVLKGTGLVVSHGGSSKTNLAVPQLNSKPGSFLTDESGRGSSKSGTCSAKADFSFIRMMRLNLTHDSYVQDPNFNQDFVDALDHHIKLMLLAMMFLATLIWAVFFYSWFHLPTSIFAYKEIRKVFLPRNFWSGIYWQIICPLFAAVYCLIVVVYPDPRKWRLCLQPRRIWRWVPYISVLVYTFVIMTFWLYQLFLVPGNLKRRMVQSVDRSLNVQEVRFPEVWSYVHNFYQCCGITAKKDWSWKIIPKEDIPWPFKGDSVCKTFYYGYINETSLYSCTGGNFSARGPLWPASCCDNQTDSDCTVLPTNSRSWSGNCYVSELILSTMTIITPMLLIIAANVLGVFIFYKTRILESISLRNKMQPPTPHI